jgi:hypothetical protein
MYHVDFYCQILKKLNVFQLGNSDTLENVSSQEKYSMPFYDHDEYKETCCRFNKAWTHIQTFFPIAASMTMITKLDIHSMKLSKAMQN